ncbi:methyl-accepting chemotaxis protein [Desulfobulbus sp.]|uniref:methyl-accepting chemotaxis protein n=1 Tax=Desulfobulbus sp. TaxID=895 RepID=UPI00286F04C4|nr:methyl-accepting chemotaxis protein [Desulfobulbus sp.]
MGILAVSKSSTALSDIARDNAASQAEKLAMAIGSTLDAQAKTAAAHAVDTNVRLIGQKVKELGVNGATADIATLRQQMKDKFKQLDNSYLGIFVTDDKGYMYTGELASGEEYKGVNLADMGYFQEAKVSGKAVVGDIAPSKVTGDVIYVLCAPILSYSGQFLGVFGLSLKAQPLLGHVSTVKVGSTGYAFMCDRNGLIVAHPNQDLEMKLDLKTMAGMEAITKEMLAGGRGAQDYVFKGVPKIAGYASVPVKHWSIAVTQDEAEFLASTHSIRNSIAMVTLVAVLLVCGSVLLFSRSITVPLKRAVAGLTDIAQGEGDLTMRLRVNSKDEIGELAHWFNLFIEKLQGIVKRIAENTNSIDTSANDLAKVSGDLSGNSEDTSRRADNVAAAAEEMTVNLNNVAAAMEQSTTNTSMVASAAEEMTATIGEIANNAQKAHAISLAAVEQANSTSAKMAELGKAAQAIGKVTEAITEISEQTNLLALNATIEAARAGDAGKGFAVVANEIKELAKQTASATLDIKNQIGEMQSTTGTTVEEINQISQVIHSINEIVAIISSSVAEQNAATQEIANNIAQASLGMSEVNENVSQSSTVAATITRDIVTVNTASSEISTGSQIVRNSSADLQRLAATLKEIVEGFKI